MASSRASTSTRSLSGSPEWPFTQRHSMRWRWVAACRRSHRSRFLTGSPPAVFQLRRTQFGIHSVMPWRTYCESVCRIDVAGFGQRLQRHDRGHQLHAVVGGQRLRRRPVRVRARRSAAAPPSRRGRDCPGRRHRCGFRLVSCPPSFMRREFRPACRNGARWRTGVSGHARFSARSRQAARRPGAVLQVVGDAPTCQLGPTPCDTGSGASPAARRRRRQVSGSDAPRPLPRQRQRYGRQRIEANSQSRPPGSSTRAHSSSNPRRQPCASSDVLHDHDADRFVGQRQRQAAAQRCRQSRPPAMQHQAPPRHVDVAGPGPTGASHSQGCAGRSRGQRRSDRACSLSSKACPAYGCEPG